MKSKRPAIILDRDGTLIVDRIYLNDPDAIEYLPGVDEAMKILSAMDYCFVIATNQSGVPRGLVSLEQLHEIHRRITHHFAKIGVELLECFYAPFMTDSGHPMRKPNPGMLTAAAEKYELDLARSWMIGDRGTDVIAGLRAGCRTVFLTGTEALAEDIKPTIIADSLLTAAQQIVKL